MPTRILFDPRVDLPDGSSTSSPVTVEATQTGIRASGAVVTFPTTLSFSIASAADIIQLATPAAGQAWRLTVRRQASTRYGGFVTPAGGATLEARTVTWTDAPTVSWADLTDVDPATLEPTPDVVASWAATQALAAEVKASFDALVAGAPSGLDDFLDLANRFSTDESGVAALTTAIGDETAARQALATSLPATYVAKPAGGTAGQALVKETDGSIGWGSSSSRPTAFGRTFVLLGNSRLYLETSYDSGARLNPQQRGAFSWANRMLGQRCQVLNYAGVSGQVLAQFSARFATDVTPYAPAYVLIADFINDIGNGRTLIQIQADYQTLIAQCRAIDARIVLLTSPTEAGFDAPTQTLVNRVNAWLLSLTDTDILVIDIVPPITSVTVAGWGTNMATDGIHQSRVGAAREGRAIAAALASIVPPVLPLPTTGFDPTNIAPSPFFAGTPGSANNSLPTNVQVYPGYPTNNYSLVARTDQIPGNWFQADTGSAATDTYVATTDLPISGSGITPGADKIRAVMEFQSDAWASVAGVVQLNLIIKDSNGATLQQLSDGVNITDSQVGDPGDTTGFPLENQPGLTAPYGTPWVFATKPFLLPASTATVAWQMEINVQGKFRLGRNAIVKA